LHWAADGSWYPRYHQEETDPTYFSNRAMNACRLDGVPVGVSLQMRQKPNPVYRVLGRGQMTEDKDGIFTLWQYGTPVERAEADIAVQLPTQSHANRPC
jgi:putative restriction endonuclease